MAKISLFRKFGALNSGPVFDALRIGFERLGHEVVEHCSTADVAVIWSVLWNGRMAQNKAVFDEFRATGRQVVVAEVGLVNRGTTWRLARYDSTGPHYVEAFGERALRLGLRMRDWRVTDECKSCNKQDRILIVTQQSKSEQWKGQPSIVTWIEESVNLLRQHSDRPITVRCHPRERLTLDLKNVSIEVPVKIFGSYDGFDLVRSMVRSHIVLNWSSSPSVEAVIAGVPVICSQHCLAAPMSTPFHFVESPLMLDRSVWIEQIAHTEWLTHEIQSGEPLARLGM